MKSYQLIIFSLLVGQWNTFLPLYASFLSFGSFGSLLLRFLFLGRVYQFVAIPLGLTSGLSGFTSLVKEVRKLALRLGISVHMLQHNWLIRANSCQRLILHKGQNGGKTLPCMHYNKNACLHKNSHQTKGVFYEHVCSACFAKEGKSFVQSQMDCRKSKSKNE